MKSKIAEVLRLKFEPVAILWSDNLPEGALQFKGVGAGCIISMFAMAAAKGKTAAFSRTTSGCFGSGIAWALASTPRPLLWEKRPPIISFQQGLNPQGKRSWWR